MIHSFTSLCIGITGGALVYMAAKTVLWWGVTGTLGLLFGQIPLSSWLVRSLKGLLLVLLALPRRILVMTQSAGAAGSGRWGGAGRCGLPGDGPVLAASGSGRSGGGSDAPHGLA